jgi:uncharacterized protein DUF4401
LTMRLRRTWSEILEELTAAGAPVPTPTVEVLAETPATPWFVRVLVGLGAWLSALFVLGGIMVFAGADHGYVVMGALALVAGVALLRLESGEFLRQLGLSCSLAGQLAVGIGLGDMMRDATALAAVVLPSELALAALVRYPVHRFSSTLAAAGAALVLLVRLRVPAPLDVGVLLLAGTTGVFWSAQPRRLRRTGTDPWTPLGYALVIALFGALLLALSGGLSDLRWLFAELGDRVVTGRLASGGLGLGLVALALRISAEAGAVPVPCTRPGWRRWRCWASRRRARRAWPPPPRCCSSACTGATPPWWAWPSSS